MNLWALIFFLGVNASATPSAGFYQILNRPLNERTATFKKDKGAYPFLIEAAFNKSLSLQTRWRAVTTMGHLDARSFRVALERAIKSPEWFMRNAALIALRSGGTRDEAVKWSMQLVADPALVVRTQAVRNLIELDARESDALLWKQVFSKSNFNGSESLWVRAHIAEALAKFSQPGQSKGFARLLLDPDERLHKWAILGLENSTGFKVDDRDVPLEIRRRDWLARLGAQEI